MKHDDKASENYLTDVYNELNCVVRMNVANDHTEGQHCDEYQCTARIVNSGISFKISEKGYKFI